MAATAASVLAINAGSSSIKFALFQGGPQLTSSLHGQLDRIGLDGTTLSWTTATGSSERRLDASDRAAATSLLIDWLETQHAFESIRAVGHRLVHGLARTEPAQITSEVLAELHRAAPYAPDHLPREIELIEAVRARCPRLPQVACFETADVRAAEAVGLFRYQTKKWVERSPPRSAGSTRSCSRRDWRTERPDPRSHLRRPGLSRHRSTRRA